MRRMLFTLSMLLVAVGGATDAEATFTDYERAREAVARGEILPLTEILARVERETGGRMLEVEFEIEQGDYFYEIELIKPDGQIVEVTVDAASGETLEIEVDDD